QGQSRSIKVNQGQSRSIKAHQGSSRLIKAHQGSSRLIKVGKGCSNVRSKGPRGGVGVWANLANSGVHQGKSRQIKVGEGGFLTTEQPSNQGASARAPTEGGWGVWPP